MSGSSQPSESASLSREEHAILKHSRQKRKHPQSVDPIIEEVLDGFSIVPEGGTAPINQSEVAPAVTWAGKPKVSYKDKLTNASGHEDEWKDWPDEGEDDPLLEKWDCAENVVSKSKWPNVAFTKEKKEAMWKPWRKSLIIKPLHHSIGCTVVCGCAKTLWSLEGEFHVIDLGFSCVGAVVSKLHKRQQMKKESCTGGRK
ncbi:hypothetical protein SLA2020_185680 [Shorea laevis]